MGLTGTEVTALTNSLMISNSAYFAHALLRLKHYFPGVDPTLERAARWLALGPLALVFHRLYWNLGILSGSRAEYGLGMCTNPATGAVVDNCMWGWWAPYLSGSLAVPIALGAIGVWRAVAIVGPTRMNRMMGAYAALIVLPALFWVYLA